MLYHRCVAHDIVSGDLTHINDANAKSILISYLFWNALKVLACHVIILFDDGAPEHNQQAHAVDYDCFSVPGAVEISTS